MTIDRDDVEQALEIACGDDIRSEGGSRQTASPREVDRLRARVRRFLDELPGDTLVSELREVFEP